MERWVSFFVISHMCYLYDISDDADFGHLVKVGFVRFLYLQNWR